MSLRRPQHAISQCYVSIKQLDSPSQRQFQVSCCKRLCNPPDKTSFSKQWTQPHRSAEASVTHQRQPAESVTSVQPLEPMLLPKLRIYFADFPWSHCSIDQRLFTSESGCGYRYGQSMREEIDLWRGFLKNSQGTERCESTPLSLCVQARFLQLK